MATNERRRRNKRSTRVRLVNHPNSQQHKQTTTSIHPREEKYRRSHRPRAHLQRNTTITQPDPLAHDQNRTARHPLVELATNEPSPSTLPPAQTLRRQRTAVVVLTPLLREQPRRRPRPRLPALTAHHGH